MRSRGERAVLLTATGANALTSLVGVFLPNTPMALHRALFHMDLGLALAAFVVIATSEGRRPV